MKKNYFFVVILVVFLIVSFSSNAQQIQVFNFDELILPDTGFWNGADITNYEGSFGDDFLTFPNNYDTELQSWDNFAFSSWNDTITEGYLNQWSVYADSAYSDSIFGLAYIPIDWNDDHYPTIPITIEFQNPIEIQSLRITNSTFTALTIKNGAAYSSPFDIGDYYKIFITGVFEGENIDTVEVFLADFINENDTIIVKEWLEVDLSSFNTISSLTFDAYSTDVGDYGINTPLYFCLDDITYKTFTSNDEIRNDIFTVFPNPTVDFINIEENIEEVNIFDITGRIIKTSNRNRIDVSDLTSGTYILQAKTTNNIKTAKFVKL